MPKQKISRLPISMSAFPNRARESGRNIDYSLNGPIDRAAADRAAGCMRRRRFYVMTVGSSRPVNSASFENSIAAAAYGLRSSAATAPCFAASAS